MILRTTMLKFISNSALGSSDSVNWENLDTWTNIWAPEKVYIL